MEAVEIHTAEVRSLLSRLIASEVSFALSTCHDR